MKIGMAQVNSILGDLEGNVDKIRTYIKKAKKAGADIVAFPELCVTGYPPQDLLYERAFVSQNKEALLNLVEDTFDIVGIVGFVDYDGGRLFNSAAVFSDGKIIKVVNKTLLPTYDVFDEARYFVPLKKESIRPVDVLVKGSRLRLGIEICEDLWDERYDTKVTDILVQRGSQLIINISASPFYVGKRFERERLLRDKAAKNRIPIFYVNLVGGQDELVFDGQSLAVDERGRLVAFAKQFDEDLVIVDVDYVRGKAHEMTLPPYDQEEEMFRALVLGVRDYFMKTGFKRAVIGMSGGIDSSVTTCIAVEALGRENVIGVSMPSKYSTSHSKSDAETLAMNLGIHFVQFNIQDIIASYHEVLKRPLEDIRSHFGIDESRDDPVADENIQPRVRGNSLMDISNRLRDLKILVLNTGNKTEVALGYCTLYGDMTGGLDVLGDVSKLEVYRLARYFNRKAGRNIIPESVLKKAPSPELKEGQVDPFDFNIVSPLVDEIIGNRRGKKELVEMGYPENVVEDTYRRIRSSEYKRWQAPPCIKITRKAFGMGWKMPIVNKFSG
ncbi:MAG: NAD+ synthase [Nitrososphaeria archaeon]